MNYSNRGRLKWEQMHDTVRIRRPPHQNRQQQGHVAATEDGKEDGVDHEQEVGVCEWRQQVDQATEDQVGFVVVVFMKQVPVCQPAWG